MEKYDILELIGEGSFGRVFRGLRKSDSFPVALKLIPKMAHTTSEISSLRSECKIQLQLSHPNVVKMLDAFETPKEIVAVTEFVPDGDLNKLINHVRSGDKTIPSRLPEARVRHLAGDLMGALHYLHSRRVLHRDLKPANVLLDENSNAAKLCDFGFARHLGVETMVLTSIKGTPLYMAPELIEEKPYDHTADLWSAGAILYELSVGHPPFPTNSLFQLIKKIRYEQVIWPSHMSEELKRFLQGLLEKDCKKRFTWQQILEHPFLRNTSFHFNIQRQAQVLSSDSEGVSSPNALSPSNMRVLSPLTEQLSESQELAKEIQRQDKAKMLPGGSQTLIKVAEKYEEQKRKIKEEQLKLLNYQNQRHAYQNQPKMGSTCTEFYQQRRNAVFPGFEAYNNVTRRNSEMPSSRIALSPSSQSQYNKGDFHRRPSNLAEYCQNTSTEQPKIPVPIYHPTPLEIPTLDNNNLHVADVATGKNLEFNEHIATNIKNNNITNIPANLKTTDNPMCGKQFEFLIDDFDKECSKSKSFECEEWCRYLDTEMQEIVSYGARHTQNGSIDFLLNQNYLSMICSPLKNKSTMVDNPIIVEKIAKLLSLPFAVLATTSTPTVTHTSDAGNSNNNHKQSILNRYTSVKILNPLLYAFKHCSETMVVLIEDEKKTTEDGHKILQNLKSISSLLQLCIRLLYSDHSSEEALASMIYQFFVADKSLNLSKTIQNLLLVNDRICPKGDQIQLNEVKIEIIQVLTRLVMPLTSIPETSTDCNIQAVKLLYSIFTFNEKNELVIISNLAKERNDGLSSIIDNLLMKLIYLIAIWARCDKKFHSEWISRSSVIWKRILDDFAASENNQLQQCGQHCSKLFIS